MRDAARVTNVQRTFLKGWSGQRKEAIEVAKEQKLPLHWLDNWVEHGAFRKSLGKRLAAMRLMREMDVARGAEEAARRLAKAAFGNGDFRKDNLYERRACKDLVQLVREMERQKRVEKQLRRMGKRGSEGSDAGEGEAMGFYGGHPDWSEEEARRMVEEMEGGEAASS